MKSIFAIIAMFVGVACFAETFNLQKYNKLYKESVDNNTAETKAAFVKYYIEAEYDKNAPDYVNQVKVARVIIKNYKGELTKEAINAAMDKEYKLTDKIARQKAYITICRGLMAYDLLEKEYDALNENIKPLVVLPITYKYFKARNYDKTIEWANRADFNPSIAKVLQRAYEAKGDVENAFKVGERLFLETYITSPAEAMSMITLMMNRVPASYDDAKLADLLAKIGKKYPAPGADFEAWKSFMGFIGYRYKALTGKDLFANSNK